MVGRLALQDVPELLDMKKKTDRVLDSPDSGLPPSPCPSNWLLSPTAAVTVEKTSDPEITVQGITEPGTALPSWPRSAPYLISPYIKRPVLHLTTTVWLEMKDLLDDTVVEDCYSDAGSTSPALSLSSSCTPRLCPLSFGEGVEFDPLPPKEIRYTSSVKYDSDRHFIDNVYMPVGLGMSSCSQTVICVPNCTWRSYRAEVHFEPKNKPQRYTSTTIVYPKNTKTVYTTTLDYNCKKCMRRFLSSVELESSEHMGNDCFMDEY